MQEIMFYIMVGFTAGVVIGISLTVNGLVMLFAKKEKPKEANKPKTEKTPKPARKEKPSEYSSFGGGKVKPMSEAQKVAEFNFRKNLYSNKN